MSCFPRAFSALFLLSACSVAKPEAESIAHVTVPHNILLIIADDVGVDQIGLYGLNPSAPATEHLDDLAAAGQLYLNAWSNPLCSPTRASLYTGRYAFRHGVGAAIAADTDPELSIDEVTIPEMIAASGYVSGLAGKWHLGEAGTTGDDCLAPTEQGWDSYAGALGGAVESHYSWTKCQDGMTSTSTIYSATDNVDDALEAIDAAGSSPWMVTVAFNLSHTPWQIPPAGSLSSGAGSCPTNRRAANANDDCYHAMIEAMDYEIGRLLDEVDLTTTTVIFIGDNGTPVQGVAAGTYPATQAKGTVYQGGVRVPLIIRSPWITSVGEVAGLVHAIDLFDTIRQLTGSTAPTDRTIDSLSLVPYFTSATLTTLRPNVYTEEFDGTNDCSANDSRAIRDTRYKLIRHACATDEFYDLMGDQFESDNLLDGMLTTFQRRRYNALSAAMDALVGS
jgi:arylsulfatase B